MEKQPRRRRVRHNDVVAQIIIFIILVVVALLFLRWALRGMIRYHCPVCYEERHEQGVLAPVIPWFRWWCLACNNVFEHQLIKEQDDQPLTDPLND